MKKLRLIVTTKCDKNCEGCCNNQFDITNLPTIEPHEMSQYDKIIITGGEPMLVPGRIETLVYYLRKFELYEGNIIIYTTDLYSIGELDICGDINGITITLHDDDDLYEFEDTMRRYLEFNDTWLKNKSLRLNVFKGVRLPQKEYLKDWIVKDNIEWLDNCPLPEGEELKRLKNLL
ncbi:MAG: hypothetical protein EOL97_08535 [Spirochaetia bacterium]|nr:hypothetical protein [Spirochaetia bacterium]